MIAYHVLKPKTLKGVDKVVFLIKQFYILLTPPPIAWAIGTMMLWHFPPAIAWGIAIMWAGALSIAFFVQIVYDDYRYHLKELARTRKETWQRREKAWKRKLAEKEKALETRDAKWAKRLASLRRQLRNANHARIYKPGYIYIMRREDGVYKFGHTDNVARRKKMHENDYGVGFDVIRSWLVPNKVKFEKVALDLTGQFLFEEDARKELRQMADDDLAQFISTFGAMVEKGRGEA